MDDEQLYAFVADARARVANESRRRTRWLQRQLQEEASFSDVCSALTSSSREVEMSLVPGRRIRGWVTSVGHDFVQLRAADGTTTLLAAAAIVGVRIVSTELPQQQQDLLPGLPQAGGRFSDALASLAERRCRVIVGTHSADDVYRGRLAGVGMDVVWFEATTGYIRVAMITDVTVVP